jgi:hypothetical protein
MRFKGEFSTIPARSTMRANHAVVNGAPRAEATSTIVASRCPQAVFPGDLHQPLDLGLRQVLAGSLVGSRSSILVAAIMRTATPAQTLTGWPLP